MSKLAEPGRSGQVQSLVRALRVLEELARHRDGLTLTALAGALELPRSTTHRLLTTLDGLRFVLFDKHTNQWRIGPQAFMVGAAFGGVNDILRIGKPFLAAVSRTCGETASLSVPNNQVQVIISQQKGVQPHRNPVQTGDRLPLHYTAAGRSILAYTEGEVARSMLYMADFTKRTAFSMTDPDALAGKLGPVRERGYAFDCEELCEDMRCVAAPIFDMWGEPIAAISVSGPRARMEKDRMHKLGAQVRAVAASMTTSLCGQAPAAFRQAV